MAWGDHRHSNNSVTSAASPGSATSLGVRGRIALPVRVRLRGPGRVETAASAAAELPPDSRLGPAHMNRDLRYRPTPLPTQRLDPTALLERNSLCHNKTHLHRVVACTSRPIMADHQRPPVELAPYENQRHNLTRFAPSTLSVCVLPRMLHITSPSSADSYLVLPFQQTICLPGVGRCQNPDSTPGGPSHRRRAPPST